MSFTFGRKPAISTKNGKGNLVKGMKDVADPSLAAGASPWMPGVRKEVYMR